MTPEEIAKLAEKLATDIAWDYIDLGDDPDYRADAFRIRIAEELTAHLAARETDTEQLAREDDIVEMEDERAFCIIILRLLGVDETDEYAKRIAPTVHELFRSRRAWRDLAKSLTREKHYLAAQAAELERLREELSEADWIIGSTNKQAGNHAEARHTLTPALRDSIHRYILKWHSTGSET
jgi:uncharacterized protein YjcR